MFLNKSKRVLFLSAGPCLPPPWPTRPFSLPRISPQDPPPSLSPLRGASSRTPILTVFASPLQLEATKRTPLLHFGMSPGHFPLPRPLPIPIICTPSPEPSSITGTSSQCRRSHPNLVSVAIPAFLLQLVGTSPHPLTLLMVGTCFDRRRPPYEFPCRTETGSATSPSSHCLGEPPSSSPCPVCSLWPPRAHPSGLGDPNLLASHRSLRHHTCLSHGDQPRCAPSRAVWRGPVGLLILFVII
jgi:hypothetical protein